MDAALERDTVSLTMRSVSKTFGRVRALTNVELDAHGGEVLALMGENGAGKSTLMKILSGAYTPDAGSEILINGQSVRINGPEEGRRLGIAVIYQELSLSPNLTVAQNVFLGRERSAFSATPASQDLERLAYLLERLEADFGSDARVSTLSMGQRQLVEICRALASDARIIVMDEPTTALSADDTQRLYRIVRQLRADDIAVIYISHRMEEIYELADRVVVLRDGAYVGQLPKDHINAEAIVQMMVGREVSGFYTKTARTFDRSQTPAFAATGLSDGSKVKDASIMLWPGEVLGLAGLVGAGRTELAMMLAGVRTPTKGEMHLFGEQVILNGTKSAQDKGIAYLTEDRGQLGLFHDMPCHENINIAVLDRDSTGFGLLNRATGFERAHKFFGALNVRAESININVGALSGGNQQKVLLSRLLALEPEVLILDEPTRGVDVGAKSEIYTIIDDLAKRGTAILVVSSDLPEITGICDRVIVMRDGVIAGEVGGESTPSIASEPIMAIATGAETSMG